MKKKLALILIIVLCVAVVFTFAACKKKPNNGGSTTTVTVTEAQANEAISAIEEMASRWVINNSTETLNRSTDLANALKKYALIGTAQGTVRATLNESTGQYTVTVEWGTVKKTFSLEAMTADWGDKAGNDALVGASSIDNMEMIVAVYNAFVKTVNDAQAKGESFSANGIGFSGKAYLQAAYGGNEGIDYALQVKGNIGLTDADTAVALEVLDADEVIFGIYFEGAEAKENCKLYLKRDDKLIYINNANIVTLINKLFGTEDATLAAALEEIDALEDASGIIAMVAGILLGGENGGLVLEEGDTVTYQAKIDFEELFGSVQELIDSFELGDAFNEIISEYLPAPLNQLQLDTLEGIAGQLVITIVTENELITEAEISLNMPKRDFRFSASDTVSKVYGPLNFAFGIKDFSIGEQTDVLPQLVGEEYFSPLNFKFTGDITVVATDKVAEEDKINSVFSYELLTDINPFNFGAAKGSLVIEELKSGASEKVNFLKVTYDQSTGIGYYVFKDTTAGTIDCIEAYNYLVDTYDIWGIVGDAATWVADKVSNIISGLLDSDKDVPEDDEDADADEGGFDIMGLIDSFGEIQEWYNALAENEKIIVNLNKEDLLKSILSVDLELADFNELVEIINGLGLLPEIEALENPESVEVYFNTEDYEDIFFVKVVVDGEEHIITIDGSEWAADKICTITYSIDDVDQVRVTIEYATDVDTLIDNAASTYAVTITAELIKLTVEGVASAEEAEYVSAELVVIVANNAAGEYNGLQVTVSIEDESYTVYVEGEVSGLVDYVKGLFNFNFTAEDVPHYGFGYESNSYALDVDIDNLYFNWGGANNPTVVLDDVDDVIDIISILDDVMEFLGISPVVQ